MLAAYAPYLVGDMVFCLDDDDCLIYPPFIATLKRIAAAHDPDVIMCRMDHGGGRILPSARWGKSPRVSEIGISAFVVRRAVWQRHAGAMVPGEYVSDFHFINSIWQAAPSVFWLDVVASRVQRQSVGRAEQMEQMEAA